MVGSGMPETYEMYQMLKYVKSVVGKYKRPVVVPSELADMVTTVNKALDDLAASGFTEPEELSFDVPAELFTYWDTVATAREDYRAKVNDFFSGETTSYEADALLTIVDRWLAEIETGMERAIKIGSHGYGDDGKSGIPPSYFSFDIKSWDLNGKFNDKGLPHVTAKSMSVGRFPLFLEGPTRYLKTITDKDAAVAIYDKVKVSGLRDEELKMYFVSASLEGQSYDMGRMMAFTPGWLENQSIWMHMSYKYYLELLRGKLFEQFFSEMRGGGMLPFMDPAKYGRSLMECSSFLASSAFADPSYHGRGFSARLSGSTAEFLSIWKLIFLGSNPYFLDDNGDLAFSLKPAVPAWMFEDKEDDNAADPTFDEDGNYVISFKLFAHIPVTYHSASAVDLFEVTPKSYKVTLADETVVNVAGGVIGAKLADKIRRIYGVKSIDAYF